MGKIDSFYIKLELLKQGSTELASELDTIIQGIHQLTHDEDIVSI